MDHTLRRGDEAPELELSNQDGERRSLADLRGRPVVVYFFPKAFTPGCTAEVCDFRDNKAALVTAGYTVLGVSADPPEVLRDFANTHQVNHDLLSDPDHQTARRWGAWGAKVVHGELTVGPLRSTFVVDAEGRLQSVQYNLDAFGHVTELRSTLGVSGLSRIDNTPTTA
jgi:peroxiredoxin Q/BCP